MDTQIQQGGRVRGSQGGPVNKTTPPHQYGQIKRGGGQQSRSCARETDKSGRTWTDRLKGAAQDTVLFG